MFDGVMDPAPESTKIRWQIEITGTITTDSYYPYTMVTDLGPRGGRQVWPRLPSVEVQGWCPLPLWRHNMTIYCLIYIGNSHTIHCMCFSKLRAITFISTFFFYFPVSQSYFFVYWYLVHDLLYLNCIWNRVYMCVRFVYLQFYWPSISKWRSLLKKMGG